MKGFTLIELLVISSIVGLLLTVGVANYNNFNRKRILKEAALNLETNLRYAQEKALSGEKPSICTKAEALDGWKLKFTSDQTYEILPLCAGVEENGAKKSYQFNSSVSKTSGPDSFLFKVLAQGVDYSGNDEDAIMLSAFSGKWKYKIKITKSGEISDEGFQ